MTLEHSPFRIQANASRHGRTKTICTRGIQSKKGNPRNKTRLANDKLHGKGKFQTQFLQPSLPDPDIAVPIGSLNVTGGSEIIEQGSTVKGYAARVESMDQFQTGLNQVMQMPGVFFSSHMIYVYRISDGRRRVVEKFSAVDDATNTVCIVPRDCKPGFIQLGRKVLRSCMIQVLRH